MSITAEQKQILHNARVHDAIAEQYEREHREIFNPHEQDRVHAAVLRVLAHVRSGAAPLRVLDVGCGSGNLTRRFLDAGCTVVAADIARKFLQLCEARYGSSGRLTTVLLTGDGLREFDDASFDVVAAYSVLHHVPDYQAFVAEMARVVAPGGVIYIDHESAERVYGRHQAYEEFCRLAGRSRSPLKRLLTRTRRRRALVHFVRSWVRPGFQTEGDIHVWPDDHVRFALVTAALQAGGCTTVEDREYLLHHDGVPQEVYDAYASRCADMRLVMARKPPSGSV